MEKQMPINVMNFEIFKPELLIKEMNLQFFANKVEFGLENVHYFVATDTGTDIEYAAGVPIKGAVTLSLTANGDLFEFYADNIAYYTAEANNGYDGELEVALLPDSFYQDILGQEIIDGVTYENANSLQKQFALTFEVRGDVTQKRYVYYYCTATRPTVTASTRTDTQEVQTQSLTFNARPHPYLKDVKANASLESNPTAYDAWNTNVHLRPATP